MLQKEYLCYAHLVPYLGQTIGPRAQSKTLYTSLDDNTLIDDN